MVPLRDRRLLLLAATVYDTVCDERFGAALATVIQLAVVRGVLINWHACGEH